jgi:hypothetical protein
MLFAVFGSPLVAMTAAVSVIGPPAAGADATIAIAGATPTAIVAVVHVTI